MNKVSPIAIEMAINMLIKPLEGCHLTPYLCPAGKPTIGIGSCYYENGNKVTLIDKAITQEQANYMCTQFINTQIVPCLNTCVLNLLTDYQNAALISLIYNIGVNAFAKSNLLQLINIVPTHIHIANEFMKWNKATINGKLVIVNGLNNRRMLERDVYIALRALDKVAVVNYNYLDYTIQEIA